MDQDSFIRCFVSDKMKYENLTSTRVPDQFLSQHIEIFLKNVLFHIFYLFSRVLSADCLLLSS